MKHKIYPEETVILNEQGSSVAFLKSLSGKKSLEQVHVPNHYSEHYKSDKDKLVWYQKEIKLSQTIDSRLFITSTIQFGIIYDYKTGKVKNWKGRFALQESLFKHLKMEWVSDLNYIIQNKRQVIEWILQGKVKNARQLIKKVLYKHGIKGHIPIKKIIEHKIDLYRIRQIYKYFKNPDYVLHNYPSTSIDSVYKQYINYGSKLNATWSVKRYTKEVEKRKKIQKSYLAFKSAAIKQLIRYKLLPMEFKQFIPTKRFDWSTVEWI